MNYPFEFRELNITDKVLDALGFGEYWAGSSDYGERSFGIKESEYQYKHVYRIVEYDEKDDECDGYCKDKVYSSNHFGSPFKSNGQRTIYFLHDLYEDILENSPDVLDFFIERTKQDGVNMWFYLESYLTWKSKQQ